VTPTSPMTAAAERLKGLFVGVPGTQLSLADAVRLAGMESDRCEPVLDAQVSAGFLTRGGDGRCRRPSA
jgi:hypothetical protein